MPQRQNKKKRAQRYQRELERQVDESLGRGPSEGQFCVMEKATKIKHRGLNWDQAVKLWNDLGNAVILKDDDVRKNGSDA